MSPSELPRALGAIAALVVSYAAACWMLTLRAHDLSLPSRLGWLCALLCALGHRGLFLDHGFGGGGEEAAVEREELMIYIAPHDRSRKGNILRDGWQLESLQCCVKPGRLHRRAGREVPLSERRREWAIRQRNSPSPLPK